MSAIKSTNPQDRKQKCTRTLALLWHKAHVERWMENSISVCKMKAHDTSPSGQDRNWELLENVATKLNIKSWPTIYSVKHPSAVECASLRWISAPPTQLSLLDNIQKKVVKAVGVEQDTVCCQLAIHSLRFRCIGCWQLMNSVFLFQRD